MPEQRIPRPDGDFTAWSAQYFESVKKFWSVNGLDDTDLKPLEEGQSKWAAAMTKLSGAMHSVSLPFWGIGEAP